jgi:hypothetical protein
MSVGATDCTRDAKMVQYKALGLEGIDNVGVSASVLVAMIVVVVVVKNFFGGK